MTDGRSGTDRPLHDVKNVVVPVADGVEELEAVAVVDILRRAGCKVCMATIASKEVTGCNGLRLAADRRLVDIADEPWDLVVIPGGSAGVKRLREDPVVRRLVQRQADANREIAAICAGPLVLADGGLLSDRKATCHGSVEEQLGGVRLMQLPVVEDGSVVTSRGAGTAVEFALRLVRRLMGPAVEAAVRRQIHA